MRHATRLMVASHHLYKIQSLAFLQSSRLLPLPINAIEEAISANYAQGEWLKVTDTFWLVFDNGIAKDVSDKIGISAEPSVMRTVVMSINGFYGRTSNYIWEWIALKNSVRAVSDRA